jgi:hypothetical protein
VRREGELEREDQSSQSENVSRETFERVCQVAGLKRDGEHIWAEDPAGARVVDERREGVGGSIRYRPCLVPAAPRYRNRQKSYPLRGGRVIPPHRRPYAPRYSGTYGEIDRAGRQYRHPVVRPAQLDSQLALRGLGERTILGRRQVSGPCRPVHSSLSSNLQPATCSGPRLA